MNYRDIKWGLYLGDQCKIVDILDGGYYKYNKSRLFTTVHRTLADCGLYWIEKYCVTRNVCISIKDLNKYYYGTNT